MTSVPERESDIAKALFATRPVGSTTSFVVHRRRCGSVEPLLFVSVPKRILARAVDRNSVKRIAREAWRSARGPACGFALMLRLRRSPAGFESITTRERKRVWREELDRLLASALGSAA